MSNDDVLGQPKPLKVRDPNPVKMVLGSLRLAKSELRALVKQEQDEERRDEYVLAHDFVARAVEALE
jgi:hypothetical protein